MLLDFASLPNPVLAVMEALRFDRRSSDRLRGIPVEQWPALLAWCDDRQVTLLLHELHGDELPQPIRERISLNRANYARRFARMESELGEVVDALDRHGIEFALLKGISHAPALTPEPILRAQGDIDLWFEPASIEEARRILAGSGYMPARNRATDQGRRHLAPMIRPSEWKWRGDMFDPEMPVQIEIHYQLWNGGAEFIRMPGQADFWDRRVNRSFNGRIIPVLAPPDLLAFAALHFLLHLLHGDLPLQRVWEIAFFLHENADNDDFWSRWRQLHSPALRSLEALVFAIANVWFNCDVHESVRLEANSLAADVRVWLDHFALSPLKQRNEPNKDELWLHLALIPSARARFRVLLRRLLPVFSGRKLSRSRFAHHGRTFMPSLLGGLEWQRLKRQARHSTEPALPRHSASPRSLRRASDPRSSSAPIPHARFE